MEEVENRMDTLKEKLIAALDAFEHATNLLIEDKVKLDRSTAIKQFLTETVNIQPGATVRKRVLYNRYVKWCNIRRITSHGIRVFNAEMLKLGFKWKIASKSNPPGSARKYKTVYSWLDMEFKE